MEEIRKRKIYCHKNKLIPDRSRSHPSVFARSYATTQRVGARTDKTTGSDRLIAHFGLLPTGVRKCQHLPNWFGKSPKWKRLQALFLLLPPHYGKC
jgi:hypothetical protein